MKKSILTTWLLSVMLLAGYSFIREEVSETGSKKSCTGHVTLSSQAEVDAFACKDVNGLLTISGEDIINLDPLSSLKQVRGLHITGNPMLSDIDGLAGLQTIRTHGNTDYAALLISGNAVLDNVDGLASLREINGKGFIFSIAISENPRLRHIDGFFSLSKVAPGTEGGIRIHNNLSLEDVDGLSSLIRIRPPVRFALEITDNESLTRCCGLFPLLTSLDPKYYSNITISGNGSGCTLNNIIENGACLDFAPDKTIGCANDTIGFTITSALTPGLRWDLGEGASPSITPLPVIMPQQLSPQF